MYDFSYSNLKEIKKNPEHYLIFIKRLLPRWANGIPDSECIAIFRVLRSLRNKTKKKKLTLVETGSGASTLALFLYCALYGGKFYTWDTNPNKGSFLRSVLSESMGKTLKIDANSIWEFIAFDSVDPHIGISILKEKKIKVDFCFFDSWHTLEHLMREIKEVEKCLSNNFVLAFDDAYYQKKKFNFSYINMLRSKLNLKKIKEPKNNKCLPFYLEIQKYLKSKYKSVYLLKDSYKKDFKNDIFFKYYEADRLFMNKMELEEKKKLAHRFDAFFVKK